MALFSKLNDKLNTHSIKVEAQKVDSSLVENEIIFGDLNSLISEALNIEKTRESINNSITEQKLIFGTLNEFISEALELQNNIHTQGEKHADIPSDINDESEDDMPNIENADLSAEVLASGIQENNKVNNSIATNIEKLGSEKLKKILNQTPSVGGIAADSIKQAKEKRAKEAKIRYLYGDI